MTQPAERLEEINSHQADDYWVLVRHEVCSSYLGLHVVPVPYLEDAKHYDLLNVLLEKSEKEGSRLLQRKSFFPMGPLREILASLDSKNAQLMEEQIKSKSHFTDDFDHEEMVLDEGVLKSIKLIVKDVNKEDSLFSIRPEILKVSHNFPWILSVRSIYVVYEVFYTTNMLLRVSDSKLIQQFKSDNRIPIGFMCRKFRLESSGMIGDELDMSKSPCRANFVNSYSNTYSAMVRRYYTSAHELKTSVSTRSKGVSSLFRFMLSDCCLACSLDDISPYPDEPGPYSENDHGPEQLPGAGNGEPDGEQREVKEGSVPRTRTQRSSDSEEFMNKKPWVTLTTPLPLETKRFMSLMASHPVGGRRKSVRSAEGSKRAVDWTGYTGVSSLAHRSSISTASSVTPKSLPETSILKAIVESATSLPPVLAKLESAEPVTPPQTPEEYLPSLPVVTELLTSSTSTPSSGEQLPYPWNVLSSADSSSVPLVVREPATSSASTQSQGGPPLPPRIPAASAAARVGKPVISAESAAAQRLAIEHMILSMESAGAPVPAQSPAIGPMVLSLESPVAQRLAMEHMTLSAESEVEPVPAQRLAIEQMTLSAGSAVAPVPAQRLAIEQMTLSAGSAVEPVPAQRAVVTSAAPSAESAPAPAQRTGIKQVTATAETAPAPAPVPVPAQRSDVTSAAPSAKSAHRPRIKRVTPTAESEPVIAQRPIFKASAEPRAAPRSSKRWTTSRPSAGIQPHAVAARRTSLSAHRVGESVHERIGASLTSLLSSAEIAFQSQTTEWPIDLTQTVSAPLLASAEYLNTLGSAAGTESAASLTVPMAARGLQRSGQSPVPSAVRSAAPSAAPSAVPSAVPYAAPSAPSAVPSAARPSSSTSSATSSSTSTSSGSRTGQTCVRAGSVRPRLRYRCAEPGAQPLPHRIDSADLLPTIQDLIGLLREIVASHPGHRCSSSHPRLAPSPSPAPGRRNPCGPCAWTVSTPVPVTGETGPAALQPWPYLSLAAAPSRREPCRPCAGTVPISPTPAPGAPVTRRHCLSRRQQNSPRSSATSSSSDPEAPAPQTRAARPADFPSLLSCGVPGLSTDSEEEHRPSARRHRRTARPCRASPPPLPAASPLSRPPSANCPVCGRLYVTCRCAEEWERRWAPAPASPGPGHELMYSTLRQMLPASSDSEGEENTAGTGR
ncbi:uncharacterized protein LOC129698441 [Leucoraja erinacea]|uniref:uncharacterized protein LOC129698441 n=1 Tax=Leucoraja erinaceus TaxID=7782 RepID=UPI002457A521|nr:uncharacterized protein LOC129698441 [Leucoraja erinacea]